MRSTAPAAALLLLLAGCGTDADAGPPEVEVSAGPQEVTAGATQYCLDGEGRRYETTPPVVEVSPDTTITLRVPEQVAEQGWSVQVFDEGLQELLGEVDVPEGRSTFDGISSSDVVPPAFYLVVVEDAQEACEGFSGAWPIGFLRAGGEIADPTG